MSAKIQVIFYSMYGHIYQLAEAVTAGARGIGAEVSRWQVPELVPNETLERTGAAAARAAFAHVPVANPTQLADADAIIFGTPTRFGNRAAQMRNFLDQTGGLWANGALVGKVGSASTGTARSTAVTKLRSSVSISPCCITVSSSVPLTPSSGS
jgi:NAD(P)H:quinone oxidoreductase type IV